MKNTDKVYIIKKGLKKIGIGSGIYLTSLFSFVSSNKVDNIVKVESQLDFDYQDVYDYFYKSIDSNELDSKFIDIYNNIETISIDGTEYLADELYIRHIYGGGGIIVKSGNGKYDIVNNKDIDVICDDFVLFKNSTIFNDLYKDEVIKNNKIEISKVNLDKYLINWDGKIHLLVPETIAEEQTINYLNKKELER